MVIKSTFRLKHIMGSSALLHSLQSNTTLKTNVAMYVAFVISLMNKQLTAKLKFDKNESSEQDQFHDK